MDERSTLLILISIILIWTLPSLICGRLPKFVHSNDVMQINREQAEVILTLYTNDRRKCHWQCEKSVGVRNTMLKGLSKYTHQSGKCECFLQSVQDFIDVTTTLPERQDVVYTVNPELMLQSSQPENPCRLGTHNCADLAMCTFDGQQVRCLCGYKLTGNGQFCTGYPDVTSSIEGINPSENTQILRGNMEFLTDSNILGDKGREFFDDQKCVEFGAASTSVEGWTLNLPFGERHFVKVVALNNLNGQGYANLTSDVILVQVCDWFGCFECDGGEENVTLSGLAGWNFVQCEKVGSSVEIILMQPDVIVGFCEIQILGQKIAPLGKTVLNIASLEYDGSTTDWEEYAHLVIDGIDQSLTTDCFKMGQKRSKILKSEIRLLLPAPKHVSHVQVMAPKDHTSAKLFDGLASYCCDESSNCTLCSTSTAAYEGEWMSMSCSEAVSRVVTEYVKLVKVFDKTPTHDFYICDVQIFGRSLEPQISECEQSDMSGSSGTISCEVWYPFEEDLASILVNVTFLLDDDSFRDSAVKNELGAYKMDITLKDLVPGSRYEIQLLPSINGTYGDPINFVFYTELQTPSLRDAVIQDTSSYISGTVSILGFFQHMSISLDLDGTLLRKIEIPNYTEDVPWGFEVSPGLEYEITVVVSSYYQTKTSSETVCIKPALPKEVTFEQLENLDFVYTFAAAGFGIRFEYQIQCKDNGTLVELEFEPQITIVVQNEFTGCLLYTRIVGCTDGSFEKTSIVVGSITSVTFEHEEGWNNVIVMWEYIGKVDKIIIKGRPSDIESATWGADDGRRWYNSIYQGETIEFTLTPFFITTNNQKILGRKVVKLLPTAPGIRNNFPRIYSKFVNDTSTSIVFQVEFKGVIEKWVFDFHTNDALDLIHEGYDGGMCSCILNNPGNSFSTCKFNYILPTPDLKLHSMSFVFIGPSGLNETRTLEDFYFDWDPPEVTAQFTDDTVVFTIVHKNSAVGKYLSARLVNEVNTSVIVPNTDRNIPIVKGQTTYEVTYSKMDPGIVDRNVKFMTYIHTGWGQFDAGPDEKVVWSPVICIGPPSTDRLRAGENFSTKGTIFSPNGRFQADFTQLKEKGIVIKDLRSTDGFEVRTQPIFHDWRIAPQGYLEFFVESNGVIESFPVHNKISVGFIELMDYGYLQFSTAMNQDCSGSPRYQSRSPPVAPCTSSSGREGHVFLMYVSTWYCTPTSVCGRFSKQIDCFVGHSYKECSDKVLEEDPNAITWWKRNNTNTNYGFTILPSLSRYYFYINYLNPYLVCQFDTPCIWKPLPGTQISGPAFSSKVLVGSFSDIHSCGFEATSKYPDAWAVVMDNPYYLPNTGVDSFNCYAIVEKVAEIENQVIDSPSFITCFLKGRNKCPPDYGIEVIGFYTRGLKVPPATFEETKKTTIDNDCVLNILKRDGMRINHYGYYIDFTSGYCYFVNSHAFEITPIETNAVCLFEYPLLP